MERLTYKEGNHYYSENDCLVEISTIDEDSLNVLQNMLDKLGAYEDAEEQGLLLRLPCNEAYSQIGDKMYIICDGGITESDHLGLFVYHDGKAAIMCDKNMNFTDIEVCEIGKTVFFSREEAEAKLAEMEGAE